jgi:hypothetical protein
MVMPPKLLLLIVFLHIVLWLQEFRFVCFNVENETMKLITFLTTDFMAHGTRLLVECIKDSVVLHHFQFFCNIDLLITKEH